MWAFIGAGACAGALPSWSQLVDSVTGSLAEPERGKVLSDRQYQAALVGGNYSRCLSRVEALAGRTELERLVAAQLRSRNGVSTPIVDMLADWPFAGYVTTNYDPSIENALSKLGQLDCVSIGNTDGEARMASGSARNVVWHVHGALAMESGRSHLVLTEEDYDTIYLDETLIARQLRSLLAQHRIMFVGFGFQDSEVMRVLKSVGRMTNPARPLFAFAPETASSGQEEERLKLLRDCNIDVIPYDQVGESHHQLQELLNVYGAMILRRSLRFGQADIAQPSYDPATTGLLIYNELCLRDRTRPSPQVKETLLRGMVLARIGVGAAVSVVDLVQELRRIPGEPPSSLDNVEIGGPGSIDTVLLSLANDGLLRVTGEQDGKASSVQLTDAGGSLAEEQAARGQLLRARFRESLCARARTQELGEEEAKRVGFTAEEYLLQCIDRRALGVALAMQPGNTGSIQAYQVVALLQSLPEFMERLRSRNEAIALAQLIRDVLSNPNEGEATYIGLELQAKFGVHLLGLDPLTIHVRADDLSSTLFLLDSSILIPLLARSSPGHASAKMLVERLRSSGATVATTLLLAEEIAEHARWASRKVDASTRGLSVEALKASLGVAGQRSNAFLDGFVAEVSAGRITQDFGRYLMETCGARSGGMTCSDEGIAKCLEEHGIVCRSFTEWNGLSTELQGKREQYETRITELRLKHRTFKHERQVRAEAEALLLVVGARQRQIKSDTGEFLNAYFASPTRIINDLNASSYSVTMRPESVLQWLYTVQPFNDHELAVLTNSLLWDLSQSDLAIVNRARLQAAFAPLVRASRESMDQVLVKNRLLVAEHYGADSADAFHDTGDLEMPVVLDGYYAQVSSRLEQDIAQRERRDSQAIRPRTPEPLSTLQKTMTLTPKQYEKYQRLLLDERHRKQKVNQIKRKLESRPKKRRRWGRD
jgi:hypothetical protein